MYRYCVASVYVNSLGEAAVSYYAYREGYWLHATSNINDLTVIWYDVEEEAMKNRINANDCVVSKYFDN